MIQPNYKVLWKEGMFLEPHHFQLADRFQSAHADARAAALSYAGFQYGFAELEIDREALLGGNFTLTRASGVFPDGSRFAAGAGASQPAPFAARAMPQPLTRSFAGYGRQDQLTLDVYLAAPLSEERYLEKNIGVADESASDNNKEICLGELNCQIRFEGEPLDGCARLLAARLVKNGAGYMELQREHSPPVLFARSSDALRGIIGSLLELLWAKIGSLARCRRLDEEGQAFYSAGEIRPLMLLSTLCAHAPLLNRLHELPKIHPFEFYTRLTSLYGGLTVFSPEIAYDKFPPYDHGNPAAAISALAERIRGPLGAEFWTSTVALALERVNAATWTCRFPSERFAHGVNLFVGVKTDSPQASLILNVLQRMKVCSREKLDIIVSSSLPGLPLIHAKKIPEGLAAKPDYLYFAVDRQGQHWQGVEASGTLGIYFPGMGDGVGLELLALRHGGDNVLQ